ncbi:MAG: hypothetical protein ACK58J_26885, partial [Planctomyces sp.]
TLRRGVGEGKKVRVGREVGGFVSFQLSVFSWGRGTATRAGTRRGGGEAGTWRGVAQAGRAEYRGGCRGSA